MSLARIWVIFVARNREFYRDRGGFGWNFLFPFLIVAGFGIIFGGEPVKPYKVGVFPHGGAIDAPQNLRLPDAFTGNRQIEFIGFASQAPGMDKLRHHQIDLLVEQGSLENRYWVGASSPKGYLLERLYKGSLAWDKTPPSAEKQAIQDRPIRYIDWLFPGILAMNMMFSALWGVGYVVVRYRKNGVLKRLKATPLTAFEFLSAQMGSRLFVLMFSTAIVWIGCDLIFDFQVVGSYWHLIAVFLIGALSLTALGLVVAARGISEELTSGVINFICWPMMFLSEVWFSLEGAPEWVRGFSNVLPLTHMLRALRRVMNDGASLAAVQTELLILLGTSLLFLLIGSVMFSWNQ